MKWWCRLCWRSGELIFDMPLVEALTIGAGAHRWQVDFDMRAGKVPAGMKAYRDAEIMDKFPSIDCDGDIRIGEPPRRKKRFDKNQSPEFNFGGDAA